MTKTSLTLPFYPLQDEEVRRIDAVRGFLCFGIFCFHFYTDYLQASPYSLDIYSKLFSKGHVCVQIFFAISGFLIFHSYSKLFVRENRSPLRIYIIKRIFRIFPAWSVALFVYSIYRNQQSVSVFFWNLFFLFGFAPYKLTDLTVYHSWSLYVEELFYIAFPIYVAFYRKGLLIPFILLFFILKGLFPLLYPHPVGFLVQTPFNSYEYFCYGVIFYLILPFVRGVKISSIIFYLCLAVVSFASFIMSGGHGLIEAYIIFWFIYIFNGATSFAMVLNTLFRRLGRYCFSFYLVHVYALWKTSPILIWIYDSNTLDHASKVLIAFIVALFLSIIFTLFLYYLVEEPMIKIGKKLTTFH